MPSIWHRLFIRTSRPHPWHPGKALALASLATLASLGSMPVLAAGAEVQTLTDPAVIIPRYEVHYRVNPDGTFYEDIERSIKVLKDSALSWSKEASVSFSTSIQSAEVIEAYTEKPDGRRIEVPRNNYQLSVNAGKEKDAPVYSDESTLSVVFPDLTVGDQAVFHYRLTAKEPLFPGHFDAAQNFSRQRVQQAVKVSMDMPESLWFQYRIRDMQEVQNEVVEGPEGKRHRLTWTWSNPEAIRRPGFGGVYDPDREPGYALSTFRTYEEIAQVYGAKAKEKAAVTERVRKLAEEIAPGDKPPREAAKALYDWVSTHITYAGNCIGLGAVVPRDLDYILDNRMGDCKDHATLLEALLSAKGIPSTQALVNAGSTYRLPEIPVVSTVNHVINYLPTQKLFVDSTSDSTPFGLLPLSDADKPVLLVDGFQAGLRTPVTPLDTNQQTMRTEIFIEPDGSIRADVAVQLRGFYALAARDRFRDMSKDTEANLVKDMLRQGGLQGQGNLEREDATERLANFKYRVRFDARKALPLPGAGAFAVQPVFYSEAPILHYLASGFMELGNDDTVCSSGKSVEEYVYHFPRNVKVISLPDNRRDSNAFLRYTATATRQGSVVTVKREFEDRTPSHQCSPKVMGEYKQFVEKILPNMKAQVIYK